MYSVGKRTEAMTDHDVVFKAILREIWSCDGRLPTADELNNAAALVIAALREAGWRKVPVGWKVVPVHMDEEMHNAGVEAVYSAVDKHEQLYHVRKHDPGLIAAMVFHAMLVAAPESPEEG